MAAMKNPFEDLESNDLDKVEEFKANIKEQFNKTKDPWIVNGIYDYFLKTHSLRAVDILAMVNEPHDKHFLEKSSEGLKSQNKLQHLTLLGYLVRRRPTWLYKIFRHHLLNHLLNILKTEKDIVVIVSALLILNILIPLVPNLVGPILPDIYNVFSKLAALNTNANHYQDVQLVHLQISLYTLFHRLYGMFPNNFIKFLRKEYMTNETYPVFSHTVKPMLDTVRVNPLLITANEEWEVLSARWKNIESHDIIVNCANLLMNSGTSKREYYQHSIYEPKSTFNCKDLLDSIKVTGKQSVAEYCKQLGRGAENPTLLSPSVRFLEKRPAESIPAPIPLTPITRGYEVSSPYSEHEGSSPPEAAIEATPETTPIRECLSTVSPSVLLSSPGRPLSSIIKDSIQQSTKVPMTDRSFPGSPIKKESSSNRYSDPEILFHNIPQSASRKVNILLSDRNQAVDDTSTVELKPITAGGAVRKTNDLISKDRTQSVISSSSSSYLDATTSKANGASTDDSIDKRDVALDSVVEFDACSVEKSGSPCSSGGLHMPDNKSLSNFAMKMKHMRSRHYSHCCSDSEHFSPNNSPQEGGDYFKNSKVRRTNSCPEMKKSSPNSTTISSDSPVLEERDENDECYDHDKDLLVRRTKVTIESQTQTEDLPQQSHFPYEHLFLDIFPPLHPPQSDGQASPTESVNSLEERTPASVYEKAHSPSKLLQKYIDAAAQCYNDRVVIQEHIKSPSIVLENNYLLDQLRLMGVQLQLEEHKREVHAERNRRLLPRSRRNKTLEEHNNALKAQVTLLQQEIANCNEEVTKIVQEKEAQIAREQNTASYWRTQFGTLQQEHKAVTSRCQNFEALLKEEKDSNEMNLKQLNESKAILSDITNDLRSCQKDAMEGKELRNVVAELQYEIIKAGELITLYRNRLIEASLPIDYEAQLDQMVKATTDERHRLRAIINEQQTSLEATQMLLKALRKEVEDKENQIGILDQTLKSMHESLEKSVQEWKKKYEDIKALYDQLKSRAEHQETRAKFIMNLAQKDTSMRRGILPLVDDSGGSVSSLSKSSQSIPKSPKNYLHSAQQQLKILKDSPSDVPGPSSEASRAAGASPISEQSKERESPLRTKVSEKAPSPTTLVSRESSSVVDSDSGSDVFKSITRKKARTECAETGQLRSISYARFGPGPPTRKE